MARRREFSTPVLFVHLRNEETLLMFTASGVTEIELREQPTNQAGGERLQKMWRKVSKVSVQDELELAGPSRSLSQARSFRTTIVGC